MQAAPWGRGRQRAAGFKYSGEPSYLEVGEHTEIREYVTANLGSEPGATTRIGSRCLLMAYTHVAHNCVVGDHVILANVVQMAGYVTIEDWAIVGGGTMIHQFVRIGRHAMVGGLARLTQDAPPFVKLGGSPPRPAGINTIGLQRRGFSTDVCDALEGAYKILYREGATVADAVTRMRAEYPGVAEVEMLARFAETSSRGLTVELACVGSACGGGRGEARPRWHERRQLFAHPAGGSVRRSPRSVSIGAEVHGCRARDLRGPARRGRRGVDTMPTAHRAAAEAAFRGGESMRRGEAAGRTTAEADAIPSAAERGETCGRARSASIRR